MIVSHAFWNEVIKRLSTAETKVQLMEQRVQPWVDKILEEKTRKIQRNLDGFELRINRYLEGVHPLI